MSFYFCRSCFKSSWEHKKLKFFCGIDCGHIFCTSCLCEECNACGKPYTNMKICSEFKNQRIQEFNTKICTKILARMAYLKKQRERNAAVIKKIERHIKEEKKIIKYIQNKIRVIKISLYYVL
ncbi:hypothetical protein ACFFRR_006281 [Megaselia abdita]